MNADYVGMIQSQGSNGNEMIILLSRYIEERRIGGHWGCIRLLTGSL